MSTPTTRLDNEGKVNSANSVFAITNLRIYWSSNVWRRSNFCLCCFWTICIFLNQTFIGLNRVSQGVDCRGACYITILKQGILPVSSLDSNWIIHKQNNFDSTNCIYTYDNVSASSYGFHTEKNVNFVKRATCSTRTHPLHCLGSKGMCGCRPWEERQKWRWNWRIQPVEWSVRRGNEACKCVNKEYKNGYERNIRTYMHGLPQWTPRPPLPSPA